MTDQFESKIIHIGVKKSRNSPAIATIFCLDLDYFGSQLDSPRLIQRLLYYNPIQKTGIERAR